MKISEWMQGSGVNFGTSGARGLVTAMTDRICFAYTVGYLKHLATLGEFSTGSDVAVAGDLRPSTPRILQACMAAIEHMGGTPVFCGYVPTPALCVHAYGRSIPSLMVTGSHIPADRNGIKFNRANGEFLKPDEMGMREQDVVIPEDLFDESGFLRQPYTPPALTDVNPGYVARYQDFFGKTALSGLSLGIYQHSAVGRDILVDIVEALGGKAIPLGRQETFIPVDTEAVRPEDQKLAKTWAAEQHLDAILTTDGDSDRPLLADHRGQWLRGDILGILSAAFLKAEAVTTPVSSNTALEKSGLAKKVYRTRIGSPFVIAAMMAAKDEGLVPSVGYEANGGFLLANDIVHTDKTLTSLPTRDAVLPMICALVASVQAGKTLAELVETLPPRFTLSDRLSEMPTAQSQAHLAALREDPAKGAAALGFVDICGALETVDETDGLRMTFASREIIHLRPSGNAPELRVYTEADTMDRASELLTAGIAAVSTWRSETNTHS